MKLVFDLTRTQPLGRTKVHGGGKYGITVFLRLAQLYPDSIAAYYNDKSYIDPIVLNAIHEQGIKCYKQSEIPITEAIRNEGGWVYAPLSKLSYIREKDINVICTVHGIRVLEMPSDSLEAYYEEHPLLYRIKRQLRNVTGKQTLAKELAGWRSRLLAENVHFVTVSEHSKYALLSFLPQLDEKNIRVFYSPSSIRNDEADTCGERSCAERKFWLMVSGNRWYKNVMRGVMAFDQLFSERPDIQGRVIVTGISKISDYKISIKHPERFQCVGFVDEPMLKSLYKNAYALLYPSLNEGFGYPPLEAMHEGCPVMASAIASVPEVCGDAVLYFNPYLISEMKMRILQMEDNAVHEKYVQKGKEREKMIADKQEESLTDLCRYIISFVK